MRWPEEADAEEVFARYASDPMVTRYLLWPSHRSVDETREFIRKRVADREQGLSYGWLARRRSDGLVLGTIGCGVDKHCVQFGYCYAQDAWGQGYATEALRALVPTWLTNPAVWRLQAYCDVENIASARVLEKAGFTREGLARRYYVAPNMSPVPRDAFLFARVRES